MSENEGQNRAEALVEGSGKGKGLISGMLRLHMKLSDRPIGQWLVMSCILVINAP